MSNTTKELLIEMLKSMRPAYSLTEQLFCQKYLEPVFGYPDQHGNYILRVGDNPTIAYTAHTDTVHATEGTQSLKVKDNIVTTKQSNCLGADCTTGLWLILGMIEKGVEGVYVAHAAEEIGGIGSQNLVKDRPEWLESIKVCLSFDRYGTNSIITHQSGIRTASDEFAKSLAKALKMKQLKADSTGTYTDSLEYIGIVAECTNISVGYHNQHTKQESQDLEYAEMLLERLCNARWDTLSINREPTPANLLEINEDLFYDIPENVIEQAEIDAIAKLIWDQPRPMAKLLHSKGLTVEDLCEDLDLSLSDIKYYKDEYAAYLSN